MLRKQPIYMARMQILVLATRDILTLTPSPGTPYDLHIDLKQDEFGNDILPRPAKMYPVSPVELEIL